MSDALTLDHVADAMQDIDIAILSTHSPDDTITSRPMSNNGDVRFDGQCYGHASFLTFNGDTDG